MELVRLGLYALTLILGAALVYWLINVQMRTRQRKAKIDRINLLSEREAAAQRAEEAQGRSGYTMAEALAGVRFPVHWQPDPPVDIASPFTVTTNRESAAQMAKTVSDELFRLGYSVSPTGTTSAIAVKDDVAISVEVEASSEGGPFVSSRLSLTDDRRASDRRG